MSENREKDNNRREEEPLVPMEQVESEEIEDEFEDEDELDRIPLEEEPIFEEDMTEEPMSSLLQIDHPKEQGSNFEKSSEYGLGMTAMILGILSLLFFCIPVPGMVLAAFAVVLGIVAAARKNGKKMGTSGIIMGGISLVSYLIIILLFGGVFQLFEQNRDYLTDTAWRRTTDGSVLYLYQDGTFIDVEKEGIFSNNFYSGTYDILSYEDAGLSFGGLENQYDTRYAYDVCLYVDSYVVNNEEQETIASTIRYLYFFEKNYEVGDVVSVCTHDSAQYGAAYPVKETDMAYPSPGNQYVATEQEGEMTTLDSESVSENGSTQSDGTTDTELTTMENQEEVTENSVGTENTGTDSAWSETSNDTESENASVSTADENHFWGDMEQFIDNSQKDLEEFSSSASEEWEKNSEAISSVVEEVSSAAEEVSSAAEEVSSAVEEAGSSIEEEVSSAAEELDEQFNENGIRKAFQNLIQWIKNILAGWGF